MRGMNSLRLDHSGWPSPPGQRLRPHTPAVGEGDGGEVFQKELPLGQTITYRINANHVALPYDKRQGESPVPLLSGRCCGHVVVKSEMLSTPLHSTCEKLNVLSEIASWRMRATPPRPIIMLALRRRTAN